MEKGRRENSNQLSTNWKTLLVFLVSNPIELERTWTESAIFLEGSESQILILCCPKIKNMKVPGPDRGCNFVRTCSRRCCREKFCVQTLLPNDKAIQTTQVVSVLKTTRVDILHLGVFCRSSSTSRRPTRCKCRMSTLFARRDPVL